MKKAFLLILLGIGILAWVGHAKTEDQKEWVKDHSPAPLVVPTAQPLEMPQNTGVESFIQDRTAGRNSDAAPAWTQVQEGAGKDSDKVEIQLVPKASVFQGAEKPGEQMRPTAVPAKSRDK